MLSSIIRFSVRNPLVIGLLVLLLVGWGTYELTRLPIDAVPDITNNQVQVITVAPSFGATDIERLVTFPIEQANSNIAGIQEIRSFSRFGLSLVTLVFDDATDVYWARQQVAERLIKVQSQIPAGIGQPELGPVTTGLGEIYQYVLRPEKGFEDKFDATALRTLQDWVVRRQLLGVKGVAEVSSFGGKLKQYTISLNSRKLQSLGLTMTDVFQALEKNNQNTGGAYIEKGPSVLFIRTEGLLGSRADIEGIALHRPGQAAVFIRDVAQVETGFATRYGAMVYNDQGEVAGAVVMMLKGANSSAVVKAVKEKMAAIQKTLPQGVRLEAFLDRSKMVNNAIHTVETNLWEGALIVVFILVLFLGNLRAGFLVASVIPLSMLFAVILMNAFGVSGNLMSLGALDFGLIVDGAVIIVEAVMHRLFPRPGETLSKDGGDLPSLVEASAGKMMNSAVFGQAIILMVYLPIFTLQGIEGKMFKPMAQTVAFALLGAFLLSLTYVPMMSALLLGKNSRPAAWSEALLDRLQKAYQKALHHALAQARWWVGATFLAFLLSLVLLFRLGGEFIPSLEEGDFAVDTRVLTGSNMGTTIAHTRKAAKILLDSFPEVEKVVTKIGAGEVPTDPMPMEASDMMVILKPKKEWVSATGFPELAEKMGAALQVIPGLSTGFQFPVQMRFNELMTGARQDVVCKIFGEDLDSLARCANDLGRLIATTEGAKDLYIERVSGLPQITVRYNRAALSRFQLDVSDVNRVVNTAFAGQSAGLLFEGEKRFDVVVKLDPALRNNLADVQELLVPTRFGNQVPLRQVAEVNIEDGPNQIQREDAKRRIVVGFNVRGRDVETLVKELQQKASMQMKLPVGYYITYGGAFENLNAAKSRLLVAVPVALLLILCALYFAFRSLKHGLLIYTAIPLSAIGGIVFLTLRGMPFSISAGIGFIALFGVAVLNGIVLVAEFNRLKKSHAMDLREIVLLGASTRLRPVLMTALVASLGFLPMALSQGAGAEVQRPLATVVIGGLLVATLLTLFVLPILYLWLERPKHQKTSWTKPVMGLLLFVLSSATVPAQAPITLKAAFDSAKNNNLSLRKENLVAAYQEALGKTAQGLPKTYLGAELGQFNSIYTDNRFVLSQSFAFPTIYNREKDLLAAAWKSSLLKVKVNEALLLKEVTAAYAQLLYLKQKRQLLQTLDQWYGRWVERAKERVAKGEAAVLESTTAQLAWDQVRLQQSQLDNDTHLAQLEFQLLLNSPQVLVPADTSLLLVNPIWNDTARLRQHPLVQSMAQDQWLAMANTALERSKLNPDFNLGFSSSTIRGVGADEIFYSASKRFQAVQLGVGIPLFNQTQRNKIKAAQVNEKLAQQQYQLTLRQMQNRLLVAVEQWNKALKGIAYYRESGLRQARALQENAQRQLQAGNIQYLEWLQLVNQSILIENQYLETTKAYQLAVAEINYIFY